ncbi:MAG: hypothetical protein RJA07_977 [Bacteroidota bacterium]|jgi:hypothetical protein
MIKENKNNYNFFKGWIMLCIYTFFIVILLPFTIWKSCTDGNNIKKRGIKLSAVITDKYGLGNTKTIIYEYSLKGNLYKKTIEHKVSKVKSIGDTFLILCDTLNPENAMILE